VTDLMCPARLACLHPTSPPPPAHGAPGPDAAGGVPPAGLVAVLREARVVRVYAAPGLAAPAAALAGAVGTGHELLAGLDGCGDAPLRRWLLDGDLDVPAGGGESGRDVLARVAAALAGIADQHRGQAAAVLCPAAPLTLGLAALASGLSPATAWARPLPPWTPVHLEYDDDGWHHLGGWPAAGPARHATADDHTAAGSGGS
jgi:hypothetical protein